MFSVLWKQDWFIVAKFKALAEKPSVITDKKKYNTLVADGTNAMEHDNIDRLRQIVIELENICYSHTTGFEDMNITNILRG